MNKHVNHVVRRLIIYFFICLLAGVGITGLTSSFETRFNSTSSILFPLLTSFLMVFHITIACFMGMKYWSSKRRLYLTPVAFGFACSALLMLGTLSSYPDWLSCNPAPVVKQNDAVIYYFFRNIMMAVLFTSSIILYYFRRRIMHSFKAHVMTFAACIVFTLMIIFLSWIFSSHSPWLSIRFIDDLSHTFTPLWRSIIGWLLMAVWFIALILIIWFSKLRNIFWYSGAFFCSAYLFTIFQLLSAVGELDQAWYQARFFETLCTLFLFLILVLLVDVFILYRESNHKYVNSYQNSIRDPLTRLYNRSFFYDTLNQQLAKVKAQHPLSVIICDLDHFKRINDNYGHIAGDKVIQFAASVLDSHSRKDDAAARIGGEEFALLLVNTAEDEAQAIAERIRLAVSAEQTPLPERMTISMGVYTTHDGSVTAEECVQRADEAMYEAKNSGRNRVVIWRRQGR
ncbi:sensor domain-containing diguanylate cyclase [Klebsiella quasipneumoniae]|uniref:sensor domain-containing diguanylate cyclase n=1 Tax=Klebsiella quasipneumoniae TaxID=1463165 RepID=UPI001782A466|nr:GGDEF domain-containing protein [Klebsiella quasipneumoniae]MBD8866910.1 GGDEF domain-containing protein [Klebsiella quasipneumoniae]MCJ1870051.1 GGDEF domain-containing protein [Klebsiella quasipneumoniae subsp. similipneumoniae]